jgi:hypothetical protein
LGIAAFLGILLVAGTAQASVLQQRYEFSEPVVQSAGEFHSITIEGTWSYGAPGEPVLPHGGVQLLLPPGEVITNIEILPGDRVTLDAGYLIEPGQLQYPLSFEGPPEIQRPADAIYGSQSAFPGKLHDEPQTGLFRGYRIASFALHPVEYIPTMGTLSYFRSLDVVVTTAPSEEALAQTARMIRHDEITLARLSRIVDNPLDAGAYAPIARVHAGSRDLDPALGYTYIIISGDAWGAYLDPVVAFETERGHKAGLFLKSWILANYTGGVDDQDDIRNFVIDAYDTWDIDYLLLVGDAMDSDGIPHRGFYALAYGTTDENIPADLYYGCLDGSWNDDGDNRWGEPGEDDLYHEVGVGRACVDSQEELENFITKIMRYQDEPIVAECDEALMVGELLWSSPLTWGGDYKDQIKDGSTAHGYTTVGFPATMNTGTLYDRDGTWSKTTLINMMETGLNIVNHLGHCNTDYAMKMYLSDIPSFDNDGTVHSYNFVYSQGCYSGAFDATSCFAEEFQTDDDGAVAVIMNSRYGWGDPGGTNGSSQYFDREIFDAMFGEQIYPLADANDDSKMDVIWAIDYGANRWCFYDLNLFGDPAMHLWTAEPGELDVTYPDVVLIGVLEFEVIVRAAGGGPVAGARVAVYTDDYSVYDTGVTDALGQVTLHPVAEEPGTLYVKAVAHDFLAHAGSVPIIPPAGPYMVVGDKIIDDDMTDDSAGNADGACDAGETVELVLGLRNVGIELATNVRATISCEDGYVEILDDFEPYGDVAPDEQMFCEDDFEIAILPQCPDGHVVLVQVLIESDNRLAWDKQFSLAVEAPVMEFVGYTINDDLAGNGNGRAEPGETFFLETLLCNTGSEDATNLEIDLVIPHGHVTILQGHATLANLPAGGQGSPAPAFEVTIGAGCPDPDILSASLVINADWGQTAYPEFEIPVGGFWDDMESGTGTWTHYIVTGGFNDQWHISDQRNYTPEGASSWKFGDTGAGDYANLSDGALETESLTLRQNCYLRFRHWMEAETSQAHSGYCYDGGMVEMSLNGGDWIQIFPVGGYPYKIREGSVPGPWPAETEVYSGNINWQEALFEVFDYTGQARFRFRFGSDGADSREGWYIDDVEFYGSGDASAADEMIPVVLHPAVGQNQPNPFSRQTVITYRLPERGEVLLRVFDPAGRLVRTLVDGTAEPGTHLITWDGRNERGAVVGSGVYFYHFESEGVAQTRKIILTH